MCHALEFTDKLVGEPCVSAWPFLKFISFLPFFLAVTLRFDMGISENNEDMRWKFWYVHTQV